MLLSVIAGYVFQQIGLVLVIEVQVFLSFCTPKYTRTPESLMNLYFVCYNSTLRSYMVAVMRSYSTTISSDSFYRA